jgi:hypothetical protein
MDTQAAAPAPATEAMSAQVAEALTTTTEDDEPDYGAAFDRITAESPVEAAEPAPEAQEAPTEAETAPEATEAPTDVPVALRKHWGAIPEEGREAIVKAQREMSSKLSDMGRQVQGLGPIKNVLVEASKTHPELMNMRPEELARDVMELAQFSAAFKSKPLETFISLAQKHGMTDALRQALAGQPQQAQGAAALQNEIATLKQQLARAADPEFIREQVSAVTTQERVLSDVQAYAAQQEHWADVESHLPKVIPLVKEAMPDASAKDVLAKAYELALQTYRPDLKAKAQAAVEAAAQPDPERAKAAIQAKSINVTGRTAGKPREMTEEEIYSAAYDRAVKK